MTVPASGEALGDDEGEPLCGGVWSQMGMFGFGVQLGFGDGDGDGEASVGSGLGGTRGSGKCGSGAAANACVVFQSGP
jgi:hypothetical protein